MNQLALLTSPSNYKVSLSRRLCVVGSRTDNRDTATKPIHGFRPAGQLKLFKIAPGDFVAMPFYDKP